MFEIIICEFIRYKHEANTRYRPTGIGVQTLDINVNRLTTIYTAIYYLQRIVRLYRGVK